MKSVVLNNGRQVRPYGDGKPDSTMDGSTAMGTHNRFLDMVYLNRNAFFEVAGNRPGVLDDAYQAIVACWERGEPAVVSTHRVGYCSLEPRGVEQGLSLLDELLGRFGAEHPGVVYMTSWEVAQLCHRGVSASRYGDRWVLRNYGDEEARVCVDSDLAASAVDLCTGAELARADGSPCAYVLPPGDYVVDASGSA